MRKRFFRTLIVSASAAAVIGAIVSFTFVRTPIPASNGTADLRTPWGDPDLQGIWTDETSTPLQRPAQFADQEFFSDEQREALDQQRAELLGRDTRVERGTELDVAGAYNAVFASVRRTGYRTSMIVDPPDGRIPPLTPEAQAIASAEREFRLALLRSTETCRSRSVACQGGTYDPAPSPRRTEAPPRYNTARMNRFDGPEDGSLADRCLTPGLPEFGASAGSFRRIVQTPGGISIFYDVGQGQGWQRNIVMDGRPHIPGHIHQWFGDSRGRWDGQTLVVEVTNFSPKTDFRGSRENLRLIERWTRTGPDTLEYQVTIEDPTVWTRPWTVLQEFVRQNEYENRIYYEPRCIEGNYSLPALLRGQRMAELEFEAGRGPHPALSDIATDFVGVEEDPLR